MFGSIVFDFHLIELQQNKYMIDKELKKYTVTDKFYSADVQERSLILNDIHKQIKFIYFKLKFPFSEHFNEFS